MKSRIQLHTPKKKEKKSGKGYLFFIIFILIIIGLIFGVHYLFNLKQFRIDQIKITELSYADNDVYQATASSTISGSYYFGLIPKNSIFFYPKRELLNKFQDPDVKNIQISVTNNILNIEITERHAIFLWCNTDNSLCDYLDQDGISFSVAPQIQGSAYVIFADGSIPEVGVSALSKQDTDTISTMIDFAKSLDFSIVKFEGTYTASPVLNSKNLNTMNVLSLSSFADGLSIVTALSN